MENIKDFMKSNFGLATICIISFLGGFFIVENFLTGLCIIAVSTALMIFRIKLLIKDIKE